MEKHKNAWEELIDKYDKNKKYREGFNKFIEGEDWNSVLATKLKVLKNIFLVLVQMHFLFMSNVFWCI